MNIYQNDNKIGFVHRRLRKKGHYLHYNEKILMNINLMGDVQSINIETDGNLNQDMTLISFNFNLNSGIFQFLARGNVIGDKLVIHAGYPGKMEKSEINIKDVPHITGGFYEAAFHSNLETISTRNFSIFDPSTMSVQTVKITRNPDEIITISGDKILTSKYCADFLGAKHCAWLDKHGEIVRETGILGLSMEKTTREKAYEWINKDAPLDFTQLASIPSNKKMMDTEKIREIRIGITGIDNSSFLNGDRQNYQYNILTIKREIIPTFSGVNDHIPSDITVFLKPSRLIQSDDKRIIAQVEKIVLPNDSPYQKARKIISWIYHNIEKKPVVSIPNAVEVLQNRSGDCNEHSFLAVALLRAAGIPAQTEAGLVYLRGRFYYHAWCVLYLDGWITADAVFNQFPADVTHIRLVRGEIDEHANILGFIGKIKLEIMEFKND